MIMLKWMRLPPLPFAHGPVFFILLSVVRSRSRAAPGPVGIGSVWFCSKGTWRPLRLSPLRSVPFLRRCIRRPLLVHSTSCERPVRLAGGQPKRGEATPPGRQKIFPSVSGSFPSGRRADIGWKVEQLVRDDQWTSIHAGRAEEALATKKRNKAMCCMRFSFSLYNCKRTV